MVYGASGTRTVQALALAFILLPAGANAQTAQRDGIAEIIARESGQAHSRMAEANPPAAADAPLPEIIDPREGDETYEQAKRLMAAIDAVLKDTAQQRTVASKLPKKDDFLLTPLWTETKEDREAKIRRLLDAALGIVTDVPIVDVQKKVEGLRKNIHDLEDQLIQLKEKQLTAPKDGVLPGIITDTVDSIEGNIQDTYKRIAKNREEIKAAKLDVAAKLAAAGVTLAPEQIDLLLDSVLSGDLVRLVAVFNAAKLIDGQLAKLMSAAGDNMAAARKYFAMHAALFAMLVHAQDVAIAKIDTGYMPKLDAILKDIRAARARTNALARSDNRPDQQRALEANRESQQLAEDAAKAYRRYLAQQREQIAKVRSRAAHDLRIADNTYETVEASFQLRNLMRDSAASFEAIQKLEAPSFDQIFKNEELRREFENLTRRLDSPSS